jgi:hypothetical protein
MVELFKSFEQAACGFHPLVLIMPGLVMVALGLFVWLGGLGFRKVLFALLGAAVGGVAALLIMNDNVLIAGASAIVAAFLAAMFQRAFTALLLGLLAVTVSFAVVASPYLREHQGSLIAGQAVGQGQKLTARDSLRVTETYGLDLIDGIRGAAGRLTPVQWAAIAAAAAGMLTLGALFQSLGGALSCATLGTAMIFAGLLLLVIFKGSLASRPSTASSSSPWRRLARWSSLPCAAGPNSRNQSRNPASRSRRRRNRNDRGGIDKMWTSAKCTLALLWEGEIASLDFSFPNCNGSTDNSFATILQGNRRTRFP